ncbi:MAG: 3'-5' exonuclease [Candidatus Omnitrophica bacterium]|nr:3'-5' exonuclease [Candidatus Omnitrophota bacterium]MCB9722200.1 3'-5' exonuclease [Candidatus Omnitrophota bacterium]
MNLSKTLVVLDLEATGTWVEKDRIIEIALIKVHPDGKRDMYEKRVNPAMAIPPAVVKLTGISDDDVKDAPVFKDIAHDVADFIGDADLGGFNIDRYDFPLLRRELIDAGITLPMDGRRIFDAQKVYHLNEKRDLTAAYKFYCQKDLANAHTAMADTQATLEILESQAVKYGEDELDNLAQFDYRTTDEFYDAERKFRWWNGKLYMMFGKYAKRYSLEDVVKKDRGYLEWILSANFNQDVKSLVENALNGQYPVYQPSDE